MHLMNRTVDDLVEGLYDELSTVLLRDSDEFEWFHEELCGILQLSVKATTRTVRNNASNEAMGGDNDLETNTKDDFVCGVALPQFVAWCRNHFKLPRQKSFAQWLPIRCTIASFIAALKQRVPTNDTSLPLLSKQEFKVAVITFAQFRCNAILGLGDDTASRSKMVLQMLEDCAVPIKCWQPYDNSSCTGQSLNLLVAMFPALCNFHIQLCEKSTPEQLVSVVSRVLLVLVRYEQDARELFQVCIKSKHLDSSLVTEMKANSTRKTVHQSQNEFWDRWETATELSYFEFEKMMGEVTLRSERMDKCLTLAVFRSVARGRYRICFAQFVECLCLIGIHQDEGNAVRRSKYPFPGEKFELSVYFADTIEDYLHNEVGLNPTHDWYNSPTPSHEQGGIQDFTNYETESVAQTFEKQTSKQPSPKESIVPVRRHGLGEPLLSNNTDTIRCRSTALQVIRQLPTLPENCPSSVASLVEAAAAYQLNFDLLEAISTLQRALKEIATIRDATLDQARRRSLTLGSQHSNSHKNSKNATQDSFEVESKEHKNEERKLAPKYAMDDLNLSEIVVLLCLGDAYEAAGNLKESVSIYVQAKRFASKHFNTFHAIVAHTYDRLGSCCLECGDIVATKQCYEYALLLRRQSFGDDHLNTLISLANYAIVHQSRNINSMSCDELLSMKEQDIGVPSRILPCRSSGQEASESSQIFEFVLRKFERAIGTRHPMTETVRRNLKISKVGKILRKARTMSQLAAFNEHRNTNPH